MTKNKNALAELAERLDAVLPYVTVECGVNEIDPHLTSKHAKDFIVVAQRIVAELAKVSLYESIYCRGSFTADVNTVDVIVKCRAIAEEGGDD